MYVKICKSTHYSHSLRENSVLLDFPAQLQTFEVCTLAPGLPIIKKEGNMWTCLLRRPIKGLI